MCTPASALCKAKTFLSGFFSPLFLSLVLQPGGSQGAGAGSHSWLLPLLPARPAVVLPVLPACRHLARDVPCLPAQLQPGSGRASVAGACICISPCLECQNRLIKCVNKHCSSVCAYLPSAASDVGVTETITPRDVQFAAKAYVSLPLFLKHPSFSIFSPFYIYFLRLFPSVIRVIMCQLCFQPKKSFWK